MAGAPARKLLSPAFSLLNDLSGWEKQSADNGGGTMCPQIFTEPHRARTHEAAASYKRHFVKEINNSPPVSMLSTESESIIKHKTGGPG